jgi:hypothetical protein
MALFRQRGADPVIEVAPEPERQQPAGKGRPTPKRRDAERRRKAVVAPKNRKEAARLQRERTRDLRRNQREGMQKGDDRYLGPRDAGPARAFARDYVDSRRTIGSYFLPATIVILVLGTSPVRAMRMASQVLLLVCFVLIYFEGRRMGRNVVQEVRRRFPNEQTRGIKWYAVVRSMQFRRWRFPKARVKIGDPV